jgi:hypothetical protein
MTAELETKICTKCKECKTLKDFPKRKVVKSGYDSICKDCQKAHLKAYRKNLNNTQKQIVATRQRKHTLKKYNLSCDDFNNLSEQQSHCCAACNKHNKRLLVDFDSVNKRVRSLLCFMCLKALRVYETSLDKFENYLRKYDELC